jgi:hypothetical protein
VYLVAVVLNQLNTYFYLVVHLVLFDRLFGLGLASWRSTRTISQITFYSLLIHQVVFDGGDPF